MGKPLRWTRVADREVRAALEEIVNHYEAQLASAGALPTGTIVLWTGTACPSGYSEVTALRSAFPRGVPSGGTVGATGGTASHTHTVTVSDLAPASGLRTIVSATSGTSVTVADSTHTHGNTGSSGSTAHLPPYVDVLYCQKG